MSTSTSNAAPAFALAATVFHHGTMTINDTLAWTTASMGHHGCCAASPMPAPTEQIAATSHSSPKTCPIPLLTSMDSG